MKKKKLSIDELTFNDKNPRYIKEEKFELLKKSLSEFPEMTKVRQPVVNKEGLILGGTMRVRAMQSLGIKTIEVIEVDWSEEKQKEFILKDNAQFGNWDYDLLSNEFDNTLLKDWGVIDFDFSSSNTDIFDDVPIDDTKNKERKEKPSAYDYVDYTVTLLESQKKYIMKLVNDYAKEQELPKGESLYLLLKDKYGE